jgi:hypothetical protein
MTGRWPFIVPPLDSLPDIGASACPRQLDHRTLSSRQKAGRFPDRDSKGLVGHDAVVEADAGLLCLDGVGGSEGVADRYKAGFGIDLHGGVLASGEGIVEEQQGAKILHPNGRVPAIDDRIALNRQVAARVIDRLKNAFEPTDVLSRREK